MLTEETTTVDEQSTLSSLDTVIQKRQEAARGREALNEQYRQLIVCEAEERKAVQQLDELEGRLKAVTKLSLLGTVKPGEVSTRRQQITDAKDALSRCRQRLDEQREVFLLSQEAMSGLMVEVQDLSRSLRDSLTQLYEHKFVEHDSGLYGRRGEVTWMDADPDSPTRWRKAWRSRAFNFLLFKGFAADLTENYLLTALATFFRQASFQVRVTSGFIPASSRSKAPLEVGALISVPGGLSEEEAFEELTRGRVRFVTKA